MRPWSVAFQYLGMDSAARLRTWKLSVTPTVYHGPYEYSVPGLSKDYLPQTEKAPQHVKLEAH